MDFDVLIVGAGVVGLACGAELAKEFRVLVVERHGDAGRETSSRNSEVIHAGIYYPPASLKAELCVEGRHDLYARCAAMRIPHRRVGKYIVATNGGEAATLEGIESRANANGAQLGGWVDAAQLRRIEPRVRAVAALWSPETGIIDAHGLIASYQAELEASGGQVAFRSVVSGLDLLADGAWRAWTRDVHGESLALEVRAVINAAGLEADRVAALAGLEIDQLQLRQHPCKGDYFAVAPSLGALSRHLIYPVPVHGGLGIHVTMDLGGRFRLGPDVEYVPAARFDVDPTKAKAFAEAVQRYLPEIEPEHLSPDFAGIRPKLQGPDDPFRDFVIEHAAAHGAAGLFNLVGIESPGLTASSAIARRVAREVRTLFAS